MDLGLKGKKALITGSTRGIGRAIAEELAREGADLAICSRNEEGVGAAAADLRAKGVRVHGKAFDAQDGKALRAFVNEAVQALEGLDILVHNVSGWGGLEEEDWRTTFEIDLLGAVRCVDEALPALKQSGAGAIIFISSTAAVEAWRGARSYNPIKAGLITHANSLSQVLAPDNVRVNTVSPGPIFHKEGPWDQIQKTDPALFEQVRDSIPMGRMGSPEEVAHAVVFLASPSASFITGTNIIVDGGLTRRVQY